MFFRLRRPMCGRSLTSRKGLLIYSGLRPRAWGPAPRIIFAVPEGPETLRTSSGTAADSSP